MCLITAQWNEAATFGETEGSSLLPPVFPPPLRLCCPSIKQRSEVTRCWDMCYEKRFHTHTGYFPQHKLTPVHKLVHSMYCNSSTYSISWGICFLHRALLQHDSWGEDRCRPQIGLCRKCKPRLSSAACRCLFFFFIHLWSDEILENPR